MKAFFVYFKFTSSNFADFLYKEIIAETEKDALIAFASYAKDLEIEKTKQFICQQLKKVEWTVSDFWHNLDTKFYSSGECEIFELKEIKQIEFVG